MLNRSMAKSVSSCVAALLASVIDAALNKYFVRSQDSGDYGQLMARASTMGFVRRTRRGPGCTVH
jgi:hypothetical protein